MWTSSPERIVWALATVLATSACAAPVASNPCQRPMKIEPAASQALLEQAVHRVLADVPAAGGYALLIQRGSGPQVQPAADALQAALACDPRITLSTITRRDRAPVADAGVPGGHVHPVEYTVQPRPQLVLLVNEAQGRLVFAGRDPGADPLGPPLAGWRWVIQAP